MDTQFAPNCACSTLIELLRWRVQHQPDQRPYTFLVDEETTVQLTYKELDRQVRGIAAMLQSLQARGERALLVYPPGQEYIAAFFGCLHAGTVAVPAYPPDPVRPERTWPRFCAIVKDAQPIIGLTTSSILPIAKSLSTDEPYLQAVRWLATDNIADDMAGKWHDPGVGGDTLAVLQYTSGSTAEPKGAMLAHGNLLHNLKLICQCFGLTPDSQGVIWLPPYHDMGLIGGLLQPVYAGAQVVLMSPLDFLQHPIRWLQAISRYRATTSGGPNFAYDLCARKITPEQRETLDLSNWEVAFNGAEPIRPETLERFAAAFEPCGFRREAFYPCYGLAEASLIVSGGLKAAPPVLYTLQGTALESGRVIPASAAESEARTLVGCGQTLPDQKIVIVDAESATRCSPDQVGEIWISGPSVAQGYWNRPTETAGTFQAYLSTGEGPFLRTGDLGFLKDDELFITGRIKDMIIVDGRNLYPQDIELTVERSHTALRPGCCAAFPVVVGSEERLVIAAEVSGSVLIADQITESIQEAVARYHDLRPHEVVLLKARSIPKTSSGKLQRHACQAGYLAGSLEILE